MHRRSKCSQPRLDQQAGEEAARGAENPIGFIAGRGRSIKLSGKNASDFQIATYMVVLEIASDWANLSVANLVGHLKPHLMPAA